MVMAMVGRPKKIGTKIRYRDRWHKNERERQRRYYARKKAEAESKKSEN